jgi:hypothetical protein
LSSESKASSSGNVIWTEAVVSDAAGDGDALGDGVAGGLTLAVFELFGAGAQPANKHKTAVRINNRWIEYISWLL